MQTYVLAGGTAVVTGAASGIGEALAHARADAFCQLVGTPGRKAGWGTCKRDVGNDR